MRNEKLRHAKLERHKKKAKKRSRRWKNQTFKERVEHNARKKILEMGRKKWTKAMADSFTSTVKEKITHFDWSMFKRRKEKEDAA